VIANAVSIMLSVRIDSSRNLFLYGHNQVLAHSRQDGAGKDDK
jgi:hypothetical protein